MSFGGLMFWFLLKMILSAILVILVNFNEFYNK